MVPSKLEAVHTVGAVRACGAVSAESDPRPLYLLVRHPVLLAALFTPHEDPVSGAGGFAASRRVRQTTPSTRPSSLTIPRASSYPVVSSAAACRAMTKTQVSSRPSRRRALRLCSRLLRHPSLRHSFRPRRLARLQARRKSPRVWSICLCRSARRQQTA
jgi:hypothetical protein